MSIRGQLLFEDGYNYMRMHASLASQMDKAFYFDSIVHGHHIYKTVCTLQKAGEIVSHVLCELLQVV